MYHEILEKFNMVNKNKEIKRNLQLTLYITVMKTYLMLFKNEISLMKDTLSNSETYNGIHLKFCNYKDRMDII